MIKIISDTKKNGKVVGAQVVIITTNSNGQKSSKTKHITNKELNDPLFFLQMQ